MGSVEEEMDKLETSIVLDTSIESEPNSEKKSETSKNSSNLKGDSSGMDVDLDASTNIAPVKNDNLTTVSDRLKSFTSITTSSFKIQEDLKITEVLKLLDQADSIETTVLKELQLKLSRLSEVSEKETS